MLLVLDINFIFTKKGKLFSIVILPVFIPTSHELAAMFNHDS